jgi:flagellar basal-body rod protein FlgC
MMKSSGIFSASDISASGLVAERRRMEVAANNIANINSTHTAEGGPYRRQQVVFAAVDGALGDPGSPTTGLAGVEVVGLVPDMSTPLTPISMPGHPDADADGNVWMPNVRLHNEMIDIISASRSYEANLRAMKSFREMVEQTLSLLRGNR